jgi:hypothetical protein
MERWRVDVDHGNIVLGRLLEQAGHAAVEDLRPVVAVGSNASPSQLRRKFSGHSAHTVIPMTMARVGGLFPGVSAHVNRWGYVPAAPVAAPGEVSRLFVLWLDGEQLRVLDATEPNYHRRLLPAADFPVTLASGARLAACQAYVDRHGCLVDESGRARRLTGQSALMRSLLDSSPTLRDLCGTTPAGFVSAVLDPVIRERVYQTFRAERWVSSQPELLRPGGIRPLEGASGR